MTLQVTIRTARRAVPGAPVTRSFRQISLESSEIEECLRAGGHNEDGTFEYQEVVSVEIAQSIG